MRPVLFFEKEAKRSMKKIYVGNMNFQTTEDDLRALFEPFGEVASIHVATDRMTGRARGFAFVEMADDEEAAKAIAGLDSKQVGGRALTVNEARPKTFGGPGGGDRGPGGPGGGRGGRGGRGGGGGFSRDDYSGAARQPREPRW
jgi:cold-inducible RNA-binding protein